jgi:hypothetical protein
MNVSSKEKAAVLVMLPELCVAVEVACLEDLYRA